MEGTLIPDYHYVEVKPDFSDLIDKMNYYIAHPDAAQAIIDHAHEYVSQFQDLRMERAVQVAVAQKYFNLTNPKP
jgi:spore maturation protein CgeB